MKKEIYENPKVEIVDLGTEDAICNNNVVCASLSIEKTYSGFHRYDSDENPINNGVVDYGESPFGGSSNRGF